MSKIKPNLFTTPKGQQKSLRFYVDSVAFPADHIGAVNAAFKAVARLQGINSSGNMQTVVKFFPCALSTDADIFITLGRLDDVGDLDVHEEDIAGVTVFRHHEARGKPYAQIVMDEAQTWRVAPLRWWQKLFSPGSNLQRWVTHEILHALGVGHTHPGRFRSLMDEENWMDNDPSIPVYDEAALCLEHGFDHRFIKSL